MTQPCDVFSDPRRLNLTATERRLWLHLLLEFLRENPTPVGDALRGKLGPWCKQDVKGIEKLILTKVTDRNAQQGYLSILHEAALFWSITTGEKVKLPRFLGALPHRENPFRGDYARAVTDYTAWKDKLGDWIEKLFPEVGAKCEDRTLLLIAFLVSSILYGGSCGGPFLVAIVRALARKTQVHFEIGGRIHVELSLTIKGVADAEKRVWVPDALSAALWDKLTGSEVCELLEPVVKNGVQRTLNDGEILRRIGRLVKQTLADDRRRLGIQDLRRCARIVSFSQLKSNLVAYGNCQFISNCISRDDIRRLFPKSTLLEDHSASNPEPGPSVTPNQQTVNETDPAYPEWYEALLDAARSKSPRESLSRMASDPFIAVGLRLVADFGVSLLSSTSTSGKPMSRARVVETLALIARSLGAFFACQDLASLQPVERRRVYLEGINRLSVGSRHDAITAIRTLDLYLVARNRASCPVAKDSFPWLPRMSSVDANLVTHREYAEFLRRIDRDWPARDGEMRRRIARLIVIISFRCGLRRSEIRRLRIADLLMRASDNPSMRHLVEMLIRPRKSDPLKTKNAIRRICIGALFSKEELEELKAWLDSRILQKASMEEYLFAIPEEKLSRIPKSLFDQLNSFLRAVSKYAGSSQGIHLHSLRHAAHSWLFLSLMLSDLESPPIPFPDLEETNAWLAEGKLIRQMLYSHASPTRRDAFTLAYYAGHSTFDVTAGSYIHLFPWVLAAFLDRSKLLVPSPEEVRRASGVPDTTSRRWLLEGGIHNIPLQLFKRTCTKMRKPVFNCAFEFNGKARSESDDNSEDWLNSTWNALLRWSKGESGAEAIADRNAMIQRAIFLRDLVKEDGHFRHLMQNWVPDKRKPEEKCRLACPVSPPHERNIVGEDLICRIGNMNERDPELLKAALELFTGHLERGAFVRFHSVDKLSSADCYIRFLRNLGLGKRQIELVSGDPDAGSQFRRNWRDRLDEPYMSIKPRGKSQSFGAKSSLSIRPDFDETRTVLGTGPAGFRFAMAMAFIIFGERSGQPAILSCFETA